MGIDRSWFGTIILTCITLLLIGYTAKFLSKFNFDPSLFVPAMIAVLGSFGLFLYKQARQRRRVRIAIREEIENMSGISDFAGDIEDLEESQRPPNAELEKEIVPTSESLPITNYQNLAGQLTLLTEDEYRAVVDFYTLLSQHKPVLANIHADSPVPMRNQEDLCEDASKLDEKRNKLLQILG